VQESGRWGGLRPRPELRGKEGTVIERLKRGKVHKGNTMGRGEINDVRMVSKRGNQKKKGSPRGKFKEKNMP